MLFFLCPQHSKSRWTDLCPSGKMFTIASGKSDHPLTTSSSQPVPFVVFYVPTFFYNHQNQRRKLCTLHNFRRCIMLFACASQFSDSKGQRFESPPAAPRAASEKMLLLLFCMKLCGMLQGRIRTVCACRLRPGGQKQSCGLFLRRGSANPAASHKKTTPGPVHRPRGGKSRMFILLRYPLPERSGHSTPHSAGCCRPEGGRSPGSAGRARAGSAALPRRKDQ